MAAESPVAEQAEAVRGQQPPALIATDLDGTFLSPDGTVSALNRAAVLAAQNAGIPVLFATGRPVRWLDVIRDLPGAHPTVIASNGAVLYDLGEGRILDRICLDADQMVEAIERITDVVPDAAFGFESGSRFGYEPRYRIRGVADDGSDPALFTGPLDEIAYAEDFVKLLVQSVSLSADDLLHRVRGAVGSTFTATHSQTRDIGLVEMSAAGVNKATMLQRCCERLGVDARRVAAFGDMPNDVDMLTWVGMPHAVSDAHPLLHELGFPVVRSNADSGVGRMIMSWLKEAPRL